MTRLTLLLACFALAALLAHAGDLGATAVTLDGAGLKMQETTLGDFVTDAIRHAVNADVAVMHALAFRDNAQIPIGKVDDQAVRACLLLPTDKIIVLKLTPAKLREMLEHALLIYPSPNVAFLQFSGVEVQFDPTLPAKARIQKLVVGDKTLDPADTKTRITVAMPPVLAKGAVGYRSILDDTVTRDMDVTTVTMLDAISQELAAQSKIAARGGARHAESRLKPTAPAKQE